MAAGAGAQVVPVELPGHGSRMKEPRLTDLCQLSRQAVDAVEPYTRWGTQQPAHMLLSPGAA